MELGLAQGRGGARAEELRELCPHWPEASEKMDSPCKKELGNEWTPPPASRRELSPAAAWIPASCSIHRSPRAPGAPPAFTKNLRKRLCLLTQRSPRGIVTFMKKGDKPTEPQHLFCSESGPAKLLPQNHTQHPAARALSGG